MNDRWPTLSGCRMCGRVWRICREHDTPYSANKGCFPLCEDCWSELTPETRLPYYELLWYETGDGEPIEAWEAIQAAVLAGK